jgi:hypothetical protein
MALLYNPGVVTEYDREEAYRLLRCPFCGTVEPNDLLLDQNHWLKRPDENYLYDWSTQHGMCIAQNLTTNHIAYYAKALKNRDAAATSTRKFDEAKCRRLLVEVCERGRALGIDPEKILAFYTETVVCAQCTQGLHDRCLGENTWSTVANAAVDCTCTECAAS